VKKTVFKPDGEATIDAMTGDITVHHSQDIEPLLEANAAERRWNHEKGLSKKGEFRKTMSVDPVTFMEVARKLGIPGKDIFGTEASRRIVRELKGRDYTKFRTTNSKRI